MLNFDVFFKAILDCWIGIVGSAVLSGKLSTVIWGNFGPTQKKKVLNFYISRLVKYFEMTAVPLCRQQYQTTHGVREVVLSPSQTQDIHYPVSCS
jgi:hypothetical protein